MGDVAKVGFVVESEICYNSRHSTDYISQDSHDKPVAAKEDRCEEESNDSDIFHDCIESSFMSSATNVDNKNEQTNFFSIILLHLRNYSYLCNQERIGFWFLKGVCEPRWTESLSFFVAT